MTRQELSIEKIVQWAIKNIVFIGFVATLASACFWKLTIEPKVDEKIKPIRRYVIETNFLIKEISTVEVREKVRQQMNTLKDLE